MKKKLIYLWLLPLLGVLFIRCGRPQAPEYRGFENLRVQNLGVGESAISADLKYYNPNRFALQLRSGQMDVYLNNRYLGKTVLDTLTVAPARDSFLIPVSMKVDMKQVYANALDLLLNNEVLIKLNGFARLGKGLISFNLPIQYEGRQKIDIHL